MAWARLALIQAAGEDADALPKTAELFGFELKAQPADPRPVPIIPGGGDTPNPDGDGLKPDDEAVKREAASFIRVKRIENLATPDNQQPSHLTDPAMCLQASSAPSGSYHFPAPPPLMSMSRLLPFLHKGLGQARAQGRLDQSCLTKWVAQAKPFKRLPYKKRQRWPQSLLIIVDPRSALEPYWADFEFIIRQLTKLLGAEAITTLRFDEDSLESDQAHTIPWPTADHHVYSPWQIPANDVAILILSDLGCSERASTARLRWQRLLASLQNRAAPVLTLSPALQSPRNPALCRLARPNPLHDRYALARHPHQNGFALNEPSEAQLQIILTWLSALPVIDSGLLRCLRTEMQWGNSELENALWNHPDMRQTGLGIRLRESVAETYRQRYQTDFAGSDPAKQFWDIVERHHQGAFTGLRQLEAFSQHTLENSDQSETRHYLKQLCASLAQAEPGSAQYAKILSQCHTFLASRPHSIWRSEWADIAYDLYALSYREAIRAGQYPATLEPGFEQARLQWVLDPASLNERVTWHIVASGEPGGFKLQRTKSEAGKVLVTPIASFEAHPAFPPTVHLFGTEDSALQVIQHGDAFSLKVGTLTLKTTLQTLDLDTISKPNWAVSIGRDNNGLFVETQGPSALRRRHHWRTNEFSAGLWYPRGLDDLTKWATNLGADQNGLYADLTIKNITQRFRWIAPGEFVMGSPVDEPERSNDEIQHPVILTEGYWLADTACTQDLWLAIMGNNPAKSKDNLDNPVEQVSWEEVQSFIGQLNSQYPNLHACLPTEAQWEYACRASSHTPFSFGYNITPEQVNYEGNYPYADGQKGLYREKTIPVKSLPANAWGLYEMHGNVWEWCQDWYGDYPSDTAQNPMGPSNGTGRVLRGGSWGNSAGGTRSARRDGDGPDGRGRSIGFRLALGQTGPDQPAETSERSLDGQASGSAAGQSRGRERVESVTEQAKKTKKTPRKSRKK